MCTALMFQCRAWVTYVSAWLESHRGRKDFNYMIDGYFRKELRIRDDRKVSRALW